MPNPLRRVVKAIPFAGDIFTAVSELANPNEPNIGQRLVNAGVVAGGGMATSAATFGADFIPQMVDLVTEFTGEVGPQKLRDLQGCAPALNVDRHLQDIAQRAGQAKATDWYKGQMQQALRRCQSAFTPDENMRLQRGAATLMMPKF